MTKKQKRYIKVENYVGIYKDSKNNTFLARKKINGKEYSKSFNKISEATKWKRNFHPSIPDSYQATNRLNISNNRGEFTVEVEAKNSIEEFQNGKDYGMSFGDLVRKFYEQKLPSLACSSREVLKWKLKFFKELDTMPLIDMNHFFLDKFMAKKIKGYKLIANKSRCSFDAELKALKMILNWYRENYDPSFFNPVLQRHRNMGILKPSKTKKKKMKAEDILRFFDALDGVWRDLAIFQFFIAGRIQEAAGIQTSSIDFNERSLLIKDVVVWDRSKTFQELRNTTKNGDIRYVHINDNLMEVLERRFKQLHDGSGYVFHLNGEALKYRSIQYYYNKALKKCGLYPEFSSTHFMRHSMGTITRMVTGNLDAAQAVTGHKDIRMVQHYADLPSEANKNAVNQVGDFLKNLKTG